MTVGKDKTTTRGGNNQDTTDRLAKATEPGGVAVDGQYVS